MNQQTTYAPEVRQLFNLGRPNAWPQRGELPEDVTLDEYVHRFNLRKEHLPELLQLVRILAEPQTEENWDEVSGYAPIHAWRAIGELQTVEAVQPLLELLPAFGDTGDAWFIEEFPHVFGMIGPAALDVLASYFEDGNYDQFDRHTAAAGMNCIAERHPEARSQVLELMTAALDRQEEQAWEFYGFLICTLVDMQAVEAAESIERAFAADLVADDICGDWFYVKEQLGVEGMGLPMPRPPRSASKPQFRFDRPVFGPTYPETPSELRKKKKRRDKAKAKAAKRSRRRAK